jgi:hypothetical protein
MGAELRRPELGLASRPSQPFPYLSQVLQHPTSFFGLLHSFDMSVFRGSDDGPSSYDLENSWQDTKMSPGGLNLACQALLLFLSATSAYRKQSHSAGMRSMLLAMRAWNFCGSW